MKTVEIIWTRSERQPPTQAQLDQYQRDEEDYWSHSYSSYSTGPKYPEGKLIEHKHPLSVSIDESGKFTLIFGEHGLELPNKDAVAQLVKMIGMVQEL